MRAGHIAAQAEAAGVAPVVVLDGDPARGRSHWWAGRAAPSPILGAWDRACTAEGFKRLAQGGVALVVIDTPSGHSAMAEQAIALADLVILPQRPDFSRCRAGGRSGAAARPGQIMDRGVDTSPNVNRPQRWRGRRPWRRISRLQTLRSEDFVRFRGARRKLVRAEGLEPPLPLPGNGF